MFDSEKLTDEERAHIKALKDSIEKSFGYLEEANAICKEMQVIQDKMEEHQTSLKYLHEQHFALGAKVNFLRGSAQHIQIAMQKDFFKVFFEDIE